MSLSAMFRIVIVCLAACLAACATTSSGQRALAALPAASLEAMVATIRQAAGDGDGELAVQPLRDPRVEDLREQAGRLEAQRDYDGAAQALDQALKVVADDPALLQERAEAALLQRDFGTADTLALRAYALGAQVGPLCRRHWATLEQLRRLEGDAAGVASAQQQATGCRVAGPDRY